MKTILKAIFKSIYNHKVLICSLIVIFFVIDDFEVMVTSIWLLAMYELIVFCYNRIVKDENKKN